MRVEHGAKRIRAYLGGELVADTTRPLLVWEKPYYPTYYFPAADVRTELLTTGRRHRPLAQPRRRRSIFTVRPEARKRAGAALRYEQSPFEELRDAIRLDWDAMDAWFEEDEQVFTHPRDPYTRVDILPSSRHVRIEVDGVTIAEIDEADAPLRDRPPAALLPAQDARAHGPPDADRHVSHCPYKGQAEYWSLALGDERPRRRRVVVPDAAAREPEDRRPVSFYPEKVDLYVDGELQD